MSTFHNRMSKDYGKHSSVTLANNNVLVATAILLTIQAAWAQRVRVVPEVESYPNEAVDLRCQFAQGVSSTTKLTQVSWIWEPMEGEKRENIAVYHPIYGKSFPDSPFSGRVEFLPGPLESPSIKISQLKMADAGRYTCEFATYPSGNEQGTTTLIMLSKPKNSASPVTVQAGSKPVVVAQCVAADGKPAAHISWQTAVPGNHSTTSKAAADGTVTVRSEFRMVPTAADHNKELTCVVTQRAQDAPQSIPVKLSVEYPPTATIQGYDENWYIGRSEATLVCETNSNPPPASITWTSLTGPIPDTVQIDGNRLTVRRVDETVNTTFVCEVKNRLGVSKHQLTTVVIEKEKSTPGTATGSIIGGVIGALMVLLLIAGAVFLFIRKRKTDGENGEGPPKHKPPPPANKKHESSTKMLDKPAEPPVETEPLSQTYYETSVEPVTDLDGRDDDVPPTGASNGGTLSALEDTLQYDDEANESANESLPPYSSVATPPDNVHQDVEGMTPDTHSNTVARGESFMSAAMYV